MILNLKKTLIGLWKEEEGLGTLEILLIVAVLVAVAIIFRKWIVSWFEKLLGDADKNLNNQTKIPNCVPGTIGCP